MNQLRSPVQEPLLRLLGSTKGHDYVLALFCLCLVLVILAIRGRLDTRLIPGIPVLGGSDPTVMKCSSERFVHDAKAMLQQGYEQAPGRLYYVPTKLGPRLMIPPDIVEHIKNAPDTQVDFFATFAEMFESKHTTMGSPSTLHPRTTKAQLNKNLPDIMDDLQNEVEKTFNQDFPPCNDWTEIELVNTITYNVARVASRMFGGTTLSDNPAWVKASIGYATDGFIGAQALKQYPRLLRPVVKHFLEPIRRIHGHYRVAESAVIPILEERERTGEKACDFLYWMTEQARGNERDKKFLAAILLKISFAAMHTTAAALAQVIFDLCAMPEYVEPLRAEILKVTDAKGVIGKNDFSKLILLDSIMKESQRLNPLVLVTFERYIWKDVQLPNGIVIPAHTTVGVPAHAVTMDPNIYDKPETFDGYRFVKLRNAAHEDSGKHSFASTNHSSMGFGYGKHACPGRHFATNEIKAMMVYLLLNYDFKLPPGTKRPQSLVIETQNLPDHHAKVLFRRRGECAE